jgi:hypothetical protein
LPLGFFYLLLIHYFYYSIHYGRGGKSDSTSACHVEILHQYPWSAYVDIDRNLLVGVRIKWSKSTLLTTEVSSTSVNADAEISSSGISFHDVALVGWALSGRGLNAWP